MDLLLLLFEFGLFADWQLEQTDDRGSCVIINGLTRMRNAILYARESRWRPTGELLWMLHDYSNRSKKPYLFTVRCLEIKRGIYSYVFSSI